ncbi:MAG: hypothetical protein ACFB51_13830 [Anaerolineae bacterium]
MSLEGITIQQIIIVFIIFIVVVLGLAITLLVLAAQQIANIDIPEDADFFETMQLLPITVPLALDLLDLAFDIFAAPIAWVILELLGLKALQMITVFEGLIPGTQLIPTMTAGWVISRLMKKKNEPNAFRESLYDYQLRSEDQRYGRLDSGRAASLQDSYRSRSLLPSSSGSGVIEGEYEEFDDDFEEPPPGYYDDYR